MQVKTTEIRRYINLEFDEKDLIELRDEIKDIKSFLLNSGYSNNKQKVDEMNKLISFAHVIDSAIGQIHK